MRVFGYCRVSTASQTEGYSLDEQKERIEAYCKALGWELVKVFVDGGESGAKIDRPALQKMCERVKEVNKVVVYKLDRLSRSQKDTLFLIEDVFLKNGVDFVSITENFDTSTPFGKAMVGILAVFAQLEREQIKERMTMGRIARAKEGKFCGQSRPAIGYDYIDGNLVVNENERIQVVAAYEMCLSGYSFHRIARELNAKGYSTRYGNWKYTTLRDVLVNPVYIGKVSFSGEYFDGIHEPILSEEVFYAAKAIAEKRSDELGRKRNIGKAKSKLCGLLYCGQCGLKYYMRADAGCAPKYACTARTYAARYNHKCTNKRWLVSELEEIIFSQVRSMVLKIEDTPPKPKKDYLPEIERIDAQLSRLIDLYALGTVSIDTLNEKTAALNKKRSVLMAKQKEETPQYLPLVRSFGDILDRGSIEEIHAVLAELIEKIVLDEDEVNIFWRI